MFHDQSAQNGDKMSPLVNQKTKHWSVWLVTKSWSLVEKANTNNPFSRVVAVCLWAIFSKILVRYQAITANKITFTGYLCEYKQANVGSIQAGAHFAEPCVPNWDCYLNTAW